MQKAPRFPHCSKMAALRPFMVKVVLGFLTLAGAALTSAPLHAQIYGAGPMSLFISYHCDVKGRVAFRNHIASDGVAQFERWKQQGVYQDYLILFSSFVNQGETSPDMVVRLDFANYSDSAKWKTIEQTHPAGLTPQALELCTPTSSYLADLVWHGAPSETRDLSKAVYLWIPYHVLRGTPAYKNYFDAYVQPQNDGWLDDGALSWWGVYINQHMTGKPWDVLFLYEYSDIDGLARRDNVKTSVRAELAKDGAWKTVSDNKHLFREEDQVIIMDPILPRR